MSINTNVPASKRDFDAAYTLLRKIQRQGFGNPSHAECVGMVYCPRGIVFPNAGGYVSYEDAVTLGAYNIWRDEDDCASTGYEARWPQHWFEDDDGMLDDKYTQL